MNSLIESLNMWGGRFVDLAPSIFWQSSLLIALIFGLDWLLRPKLRPAVHYALWLVVMVKLVLPPTLAFPTGAAWWLRTHTPSQLEAPTQIMTASLGPSTPNISTLVIPLRPPALLPAPTLSFSAWVMLTSAFVSILLLAWTTFRWWKINRRIRETIAPAEPILALFEETRRHIRAQKNVAIRLTTERMSPAVCGLWRPIVLLPQPLIEKLSPEQLRAVLLHELVHVRRRDVWINCAQTLLQIVYWWHPLVWFANARIRRVREEAVDDAVMVALNAEAEIYAPTLLEVAKLAFSRPVAALGIIGILESRTALRHRIERLLNFKTPGRAGLSAVWILALAAFTAVAVPMGKAPPHLEGMSASELNAHMDAAATNSPQTKILDSNGNIIDAAPFMPGAPHTGTNTIVLGTNPLTVIAQDSNGNTIITNAASLPGASHINVIHTNSIRQKIFEKLNNIAIDQISFTNTPLREVIRTLSEQVYRQDPDHEGLNFTIQKGETKSGETEMDTAEVKIDLRPGLKRVRLHDLLEAIIKSSDWPIKYSIHDYGIEFSFHGTSQPELLTRTFIVDSNALYLKLEQIGMSSTDAKGMLGNFFKAAGISLDPPKSFYFNDTLNKLTVHGTSEELDLIRRLLPSTRDSVKDSETATSIQNTKPANGTQDSAPPQNQPALATRTFKVDMNVFSRNLGATNRPGFDPKTSFQFDLVNLFQSLGVDMHPPKSFFFNDRTGTVTVHASTNDLELIEQAVSTLNTLPPEVNIKARFVEVDADNSGMDAIIKKILREQQNGAANTNASTGILSHPQLVQVLQVLEKRKGAKLLNEGEVTTMSGRQANFQIIDVKTLVTGLKATVTNNETHYIYKTDTQPFGSTLDVVPNVSADGENVSMTVTPRITEFLGYENPKDVAKYDEKLKGAKLPLPITRVRTTTTAATIRDGQTLVIGNLGDQSVITGPEGTASSRQAYTDKKKKQILIFVTVNIIDPSGKFAHSRDYYDTPAVY